MNKNYLLLSVIIVILLAGFLFFNKNKSINQATPTDLNRVTGIAGGGSTSLGEYSGKVLAGNSSPFIEFNSADYEKAQSEGKLILLDFYANWCPICRGEEPELKAGFDSLTRSDIVGFRVNYKDPDTDNEEKKLADQLEVPYQHTKVVLKNGEVVLKDGEPWDKEKFLEELTKNL